MEGQEGEETWGWLADSGWRGNSPRFGGQGFRGEVFPPGAGAGPRDGKGAAFCGKGRVYGMGAGCWEHGGEASRGTGKDDPFVPGETGPVCCAR